METSDHDTLKEMMHEAILEALLEMDVEIPFLNAIHLPTSAEELVDG